MIGTALPSSKLYPDGLVSRRKAGMKKKSDLDAIDPYLMIGIEGMLLCEYSEVARIVSAARNKMKARKVKQTS